MQPDDRVCVVAVRPATFERCQGRGLYPIPAGYSRATAAYDHLAIYRPAPVSAVTHVAPVVDRVEQTRGGPGPMRAGDWAATVEPFADTDRVTVLELGDLVALADPVVADGTGVRGAWYCTIADLRAADTTAALAARAGD
ncbi:MULTISPECIES: hypothetical protein [Halobacterium]|nr:MULTISPECIES: hypothetical protein [Halobacterium]MDL0123566.1 hypothetical protein [Halobacterium salinarum]QRY24508.1 hypothetical protein JRZ79_08850 [Halobacterium sp. BOL4-2]